MKKICLLLCFLLLFPLTSCDGTPGEATGPAPTAATTAATTVRGCNTETPSTEEQTTAGALEILPPGTRTPVDQLPAADQSAVGTTVKLSAPGAEETTILAFLLVDGEGLVLEIGSYGGNPQNAPLLRILCTSLTDAVAFEAALATGIEGELLAISRVCFFDLMYTVNAWKVVSDEVNAEIPVSVADPLCYYVRYPERDVDCLISASRADEEGMATCTEFLQIVLERFSLEAVFPIA